MKTKIPKTFAKDYLMLLTGFIIMNFRYFSFKIIS